MGCRTDCDADEREGKAVILDMHVHTAASDDSTATIEGYIELILAYRHLHPFDGFVLTEHRHYTPGLNLQRYWDEYGVLIMQGVEMDTSQGHLLVYGITERLLEQIDVTQRLHNGRQIIPQLTKFGAVAAPSHPFRESILGSIMEKDITEVAGVQIIESYNGQNSQGQNERAAALAAQHDLRTLGGSDAHYLHPRWFLTCATAFDDAITSEADLIEALHYGSYRPIVLPAMDEADAPIPPSVSPRL
jgi:predicted metal-dependent phosphoesterase TrpH